MQNIHHDLTLSWQIFQCSKIPMKSSIIFPMLNRSSKNPRLLDKSSKNPRDPHNKSWKNPRILDKSHEKNSPPRGKTKISSNILFVSFNTLHILRKSSEDMRFLESLKTCSNNHNRKHVLLKLHLKDRKKQCFSPEILIKCSVNHPKKLYILQKNYICYRNHQDILILSSEQTSYWTRDIIIIIIIITISVVEQL